MKKYVLAILLCGVAAVSHAQNASVERSFWGIQTGYFGVWVHNEHRLSNSIALRSEIGLDSGIFDSNYSNKTGFIFIPVITVEPRWYYNLGKRLRESKRIANNSGNFVAIEASYNPDWFVISNYNDITALSNISLVPTWSIRRNIGNHFDFEVGIGAGYQHIFAKKTEYNGKENDFTIILNLRIGYIF